ncbi:MAG: hypothetical protein F6K00_35065 [Leptolyngbya sp. SIOISBB]|nr:hypothetical protein [Leptolyngbya sp. SIOISBB]
MSIYLYRAGKITPQSRYDSSDRSRVGLALSRDVNRTLPRRSPHATVETI